MDNSPFSWSRGVLICFIEGSANRLFEYGLGLDAAERQELVVKHVAYALNTTKALEGVLAVHELQWADQQWTPGAYGAYFPPGVITGGFWSAYRKLSELRSGLHIA